MLTIYEFFVTLPDRFYPFANEVNGHRVRGIRSYRKAVACALQKNGIGRLGYKLMIYRQVFHFIGSILFIVFATLVSKEIFGSEVSLYFLLVTAIVALTYQEFYVHPRRYAQRIRKSFLDWFFWIVPMLIYLFH